MDKIALTLLMFGFAAASTAQPKSQTYAKDGIRLVSYDFAGLEPNLKKDNDTIYVVNFWATWCAPCVKELPFFERLNSNYKDRKVKVLLVSLDMKKQIESTLIPFVKKKNLQSAVVHLHDPDADAWISKVDPRWTGALPATLIYSGQTRKFYEQSFTYETLAKEVNQFIK